MSENFWNEKRVLITGATGFIGSWLTENLVSKGSKVSVFVKNDVFGIDAIKHLRKKIKIFYGDMVQKDTITPAIKDQEIVLHLAAYSQVLKSIENPVEAFSVNVGGTLNLLEGLRKTNANQTLVFASTDKVYGEPKSLPIGEDHVLNAKSPYDASKLAADRLAYSYFTSYGTPVSIARWSNTIGGRDANSLRAVPDFVTSLLNSRPLKIRRTGEDIRDYMYVTDSVRGIELLAENIKTTKGDAFNFGTERPMKLIDLVGMISKLMGFTKSQPIVSGKTIPGEIDEQYLSAKKARESLKWKPEVGLEEAVKRTIEWYSQNRWWEEVMKRVASSQ